VRAPSSVDEGGFIPTEQASQVLGAQTGAPLKPRGRRKGSGSCNGTGVAICVEFNAESRMPGPGHWPVCRGAAGHTGTRRQGGKTEVAERSRAARCLV
jgi:hypothetical protein